MKERNNEINNCKHQKQTLGMTMHNSLRTQILPRKLGLDLRKFLMAISIRNEVPTPYYSKYSYKMTSRMHKCPSEQELLLCAKAR